MTHTPSDDELRLQAAFNQIVIDALKECESCCLDDKDDFERVAHTVLMALRNRASYEDFVAWREEFDCDMLLDSFDLAIAWMSGRGVFDQDAPDLAMTWRDLEDVRNGVDA